MASITGFEDNIREREDEKQIHIITTRLYNYFTISSGLVPEKVTLIYKLTFLVSDYHV